MMAKKESNIDKKNEKKFQTHTWCLSSNIDCNLFGFLYSPELKSRIPSFQ